MMRYDIATLLLLANYEEYLPYMTDDDVLEILEFGLVPSAFKVRDWQRAAQCAAERLAMLDDARLKHK